MVSPSLSPPLSFVYFRWAYVSSPSPLTNYHYPQQFITIYLLFFYLFYFSPLFYSFYFILFYFLFFFLFTRLQKIRRFKKKEIT